jgi:hypothetical protein
MTDDTLRGLVGGLVSALPNEQRLRLACLIIADNSVGHARAIYEFVLGEPATEAAEVKPLKPTPIVRATPISPSRATAASERIKEAARAARPVEPLAPEETGSATALPKGAPGSAEQTRHMVWVAVARMVAAGEKPVAQALSDRLDIERGTVLKHTAALVEQGKLRREGSRRGSTLHVLEWPPEVPAPLVERYDEPKTKRCQDCRATFETIIPDQVTCEACGSRMEGPGDTPRSAIGSTLAQLRTEAGVA